MFETTWPISSAAVQFGAAPAVVDGRRVVTFRDLDAQARGVAAALHAAGVGPGDRVAIASLPSAHTIALLLGCFYLGAIACPLNTRIPRHGMAEAIHRIRCMVLVVDEYFAVLQLSHIPTLRLPDILTAARQAVEAPLSPRLEQQATILFTSGSTDEPKAAMHTFANHYANAAASNRNIVVDPGDRWLLTLPLYHVSGLGIVFRCLLGGSAIAIAESGERLERAIVHYRITHVSLVATQLFRLLQTKNGVDAMRRLKAILIGGSAIPTSLIRAAHELELPLYTTFGMTEMSSQVTTTPPGASLDALLTSGRPLIQETVRIAASGEIEVRGPALFAGYVDEGSPNLPLTIDGWFPTGDLGAFDQEGNLSVVGRKDNLFNSGGENVQPEEIERYLCRVEGVLQAVVVPVQCAEFGFRPVAFVRMDAQHPLRPAILAAYLAKYLARYKIPQAFFPWPEEKDEAGMKVNRGLFEELAKQRGLTSK